MTAEEELRRVNEDLAKDEKALKNMLYDLKRAHEELSDTQAQLLQSEKLAAIGQLFAGVAHEVKNPLSIILLSIESIESSVGNLGEKEKRNIKMIKDAAERANKVVKDLLNFSRSSEIALRPVNIHQALDETIALIQNSARLKNIEIHQEYTDENNVIIEADNILLQQTFLNIFANAIDAIEEKGTITVKTILKEKGDDSRKDIAIEISDTGQGMSKEVASKVFDPFFTTKEQGKGTGLGLSMVYTIIKKHRGIIKVESKKGKGTVFTIELPLKA